jgi:hypothetical protein
MATRAKKVRTGAAESGTDWELVGSPTPTQRISARRLPLDSLEATRREMSRVYREMRSGSLPSHEGTKLVYVLSKIGELLTIVQIERRIDALETGTALPPPERNDDGLES